MRKHNLLLAMTVTLSIVTSCTNNNQSNETHIQQTQHPQTNTEKPLENDISSKTTESSTEIIPIEELPVKYTIETANDNGDYVDAYNDVLQNKMEFINTDGHGDVNQSIDIEEFLNGNENIK